MGGKGNGGSHQWFAADERLILKDPEDQLETAKVKRGARKANGSLQCQAPITLHQQSIGCLQVLTNP